MTLNQDGHVFSGVISVGEISDIPNKIKLLEQEIEQLKLTVAELSSGQFSLNDSISGNAKLIANEAEARSHALLALQIAISQLSSQ